MSTFYAGDDVAFTGRGGYASDRREASAVLTVGHTYRVVGCMRGRFYTGLFLSHPAGRVGPFNSVLFEAVGKAQRPEGSAERSGAHKCS